MGRLYRRSISGEKTLATFENGRVQGENNASDMSISYNNVGQIFRPLPDGGVKAIANCDNSGCIRKGNSVFGFVVAKCEDGVTYEGSHSGGRIIAYYNGDMYGAAAATALLLGL